MSEKGIAIADQTGGTKVATRDAVEQTATSDPRVIQLVDFASRALTVSVIRSVTIADSGSNIGNTSSEWYQNRIAVGDKSTLVVLPEVTSGVVGIIVTPLLYDAGNNLLGCLPAKTVDLSGYPLALASTNIIFDLMAWDLFGASSVGLHVTDIGGAGTVVLKGGVL